MRGISRGALDIDSAVGREKIDDFFTIEQKLMASEALRNAMAGYHDLVNRGRRKIYRIEL